MSVTATVAEWLTLPAEPVDVPVIVRLPVIVLGLLGPPQPAKAMRSTTAVAANPSRTRSPLAFSSRKSNSNARISGTSCGIEIGGVRAGGVDTGRALLVLVSVTCTDCAVTPSAAVIGDATVQVEPVGAPVQVNATL